MNGRSIRAQSRRAGRAASFPVVMPLHGCSRFVGHCDARIVGVGV